MSLTWTASTDNVGVAGYDVHRSATSGFTAGPDTEIGSVTAGTTYSDASRPVGTWFYRVVAVDASGNASAASSQATAAVSGGAVQTVTLSPTEDSYASQATPTVNFGSSSSMASRGGTASYAAYLKFVLGLLQRVRHWLVRRCPFEQYYRYFCWVGGFPSGVVGAEYVDGGRS